MVAGPRCQLWQGDTDAVKWHVEGMLVELEKNQNERMHECFGMSQRGWQSGRV